MFVKNPGLTQTPDSQKEFSTGEAISMVRKKLKIIACSPSALLDIASRKTGPYGSATYSFNLYTWNQLKTAVHNCNLLNRLADYARLRDDIGECSQTHELLKKIRIDFRNELQKFDNQGAVIVNGVLVRKKAEAA